MIPFLAPGDPFPPVERALREPNGLLAAGGDLSVDRLLHAYANGIFPWFGEDDPLLWWSPDPRMVIETGGVHVSRSLRKTIRSGRFQVTADRAFAAVMSACAEARPGQDGTWITAGITAAYARLHTLGYAHSVEVWLEDALAGGLYGVAIGRMFFGESMFTRVTDASKVALVALARQLHRWDMPCIDCQVATSHLASLGAHEVPRRQFLSLVRRLVREPPPPVPWQFDADVAAAPTHHP